MTMKLRTKTDVDYRQQRVRNNLSAIESRRRRKQREEEAFQNVEILTKQIVEYKIKIAALEAKNSILETNNDFYKNQMLLNCVFLPPLKNTELPEIKIKDDDCCLFQTHVN